MYPAFPSWPIAKIKLQVPSSPISLQNSLWKTTERTNLWDTLGSYLFDQHLNIFRESAITILTERDPSFELPTDERFAANIHGKALTYSQDLRTGLANGLAILGSRPHTLTNCSHGKAEDTAISVICEVFADADWILWGSLNNCLPALAEAALDEFLRIVEDALCLSSCPFDDLFSQEGSSAIGNNYLTGLLWALEGLAWDEKYLVRVCVILGELASHDPGGTWANRPANSLLTILLPWYPQAIAPIEKRKVSVKTLYKKYPETAWKLTISSLLPNVYQISMGSYKPLWRDTIPKDWNEGVTHQEYWDQIVFYAEFAVSIADSDTIKLSKLIDYLDALPKPSSDKFLELLSADAILDLPEEERLPLWNKLTKFTSEHRHFSDTTWALNDDSISKIEEVTNKLAPSNPLNLYRYLFSGSAQHLDFYEEINNWEDQQKKLDELHQKAVKEILKLDGIASAIQFTETVKSPDQLGRSLGCIADIEIDTTLLPAYLNVENHKISFFTNGYIWSRYTTNSWPWADNLDKSDWNNGQISQFLNYLPFTNEIWNRAAAWLNDTQGYYWKIVNVDPYQTDGSLDIAIDKLIEYERPYAAIDCLIKTHPKS